MELRLVKIEFLRERSGTERYCVESGKSAAVVAAAISAPQALSASACLLNCSPGILILTSTRIVSDL